MKLLFIILFLPLFAQSQDSSGTRREYHFVFQDSGGHRILFQTFPDTAIAIEGDTMQLIKEMMIEFVKTDKLLQKQYDDLRKNHFRELKHLKKYLQQTVGQFEAVRSHTSDYTTYKWMVMDTDKGSISKIDDWHEAGLGTLKQNHNYMFLITLSLGKFFIIMALWGIGCAIAGYLILRNNPKIKAHLDADVNKLSNTKL